MHENAFRGLEVRKAAAADHREVHGFQGRSENINNHEVGPEISLLLFYRMWAFFTKHACTPKKIRRCRE